MYNVRRDAEALRKNLFKLCKHAQSLLEIGFNGGHSNALYFQSNSKLRVVSFDICYHKYTKPVVEHFKSLYDLTFVEGDSRIEVPKYVTDEKFDIIHIDGGHGADCAVNDLLNCARFAHKETLMVFDDSNFHEIHHILEANIAKGLIAEIDYGAFDLEQTHLHRIFRYRVVR